MQETWQQHYNGIQIVRLEKLVCDVEIIGEDRTDIEVSYVGEFPLIVQEAQHTLVLSMQKKFALGVQLKSGRLIIRTPLAVDTVHIRKTVGNFAINNLAVSNLQMSGNIGNLLCLRLIVDELLAVSKNIGETTIVRAKANQMVVRKNIGNVHLNDCLLTVTEVYENIGDIYFARGSVEELYRKTNIGRVSYDGCAVQKSM